MDTLIALTYLLTDAKVNTRPYAHILYLKPEHLPKGDWGRSEFISGATFFWVYLA